MKRKMYLPVRKEVITPSQFLQLQTNDPSSITSSQFIPPIVGVLKGKAKFGQVEVTYRQPMLRVGSVLEG